MNTFTGVFQGHFLLFSNLLPVIKCIKKVPVIAYNRNFIQQNKLYQEHMCRNFCFFFADDTFEGL